MKTFMKLGILLSDRKAVRYRVDAPFSDNYIPESRYANGFSNNRLGPLK